LARPTREDLTKVEGDKLKVEGEAISLKGEVSRLNDTLIETQKERDD
jgi:hypothetical protein